VTLLGIFPARWLAVRLGAIAEPGERDIHSQPTPRLGGIAMYVGFAVAAVLFSANPKTVGLLLASWLVTFAMVLDDRNGLSPWVKLLIQVLAAAVAIVGFGITIDFIALPMGIIHLGLLAIPITLFWFVALQNTINLLDGVDGLAAGVVAIVAGTIMLAAINLRRPDIVVLCGALIGSCLGFLIFNWHPARIFMGDAGSHFLGLTLAALSVLSVAKVTLVLALAVPIVALSIPILDTGWAIVRRRLRGRSIAAADAQHLHHRLLDYGLSPRETTLVFYFGTAIFGAVGLTIYGHRRVILGAIALMVMAIVVIMVRLWYRSRRPPVRLP
jgi:UDP-GlcNAc:undecaprenyl-phosphate GlcNAc-1-phosphate transferase